MKFPEPCEDCRRSPGWTHNPDPNSRACTRCKCAYGTAIVHFSKHKNDYLPPVISTEHATFCAEMMSTIPFFPSESGARVAIADEIACMAATPQQAIWIARRMVRLYSRWPGLAEMRRLFWRNHRPLDGVDEVGWSEQYPSGFPKDLGQPESAMISAYESGQLQIEAPK